MTTLLPPLICALSLMFPASERLYGELTLEQWQDCLHSLDPKDVQNAHHVPGLIEVIQDNELSSATRRPFAMMLARMGAISESAIPVLRDQIRMRGQLAESTYAWAARALGIYGIVARPAVPELVEMLFDEDLPTGDRTLPIEALARIGTAHPEVMPALLQLLQYQGIDSSKVTAAQASVFRELAIEALAYIGPDADLAAPLLVRAVRTPQETQEVRRKAVVALGAIGSRAALAIPALVETLEFDSSSALRLAAAEALGKIGTPALPLLTRYLQHRDPQIRALVVQSMVGMGRQARAAQPQLVNALADSAVDVRIAACEALAAITAAPAAYVPVLITLLDCDQRQVRMRAMRLLCKLGPRVAPYRQQLVQLQDSDNAATRALVRKTLKELGLDRP